MTGAALNDFHRIEPHTLELDKLGDKTGPVDVGGASAVTIQTTLVEGSSWGSGVLTVERSNDGQAWFSLASSTTISSDTLTAITPDTKFLRVKVSTAGSSGDRVSVSIYSRLS